MSHMTKVVWLPNETDYSYCDFVAPNAPYWDKMSFGVSAAYISHTCPVQPGYPGSFVEWEGQILAILVTVLKRVCKESPRGQKIWSFIRRWSLYAGSITRKVYTVESRFSGYLSNQVTSLISWCCESPNENPIIQYGHRTSLIRSLRYSGLRSAFRCKRLNITSVLRSPRLLVRMITVIGDCLKVWKHWRAMDSKPIQYTIMKQCTKPG